MPKLHTQTHYEIEYRIKSTANINKFREILHSSDFSMVYSSNNVDECWCHLKCTILNAWNEAVPIRRKRVKKFSPRKPWVAQEILNFIAVRDEFYKLAKTSKDQALWKQFKIEKNRVNTLINRKNIIILKTSSKIAKIQVNSGNQLTIYWAIIK